MPARRTQALGPDGSPLPDSGKEKLTFGCAFPGCGQTYSRMEYLKRHQRKHQDERPFQCKDCSKAFARSDVLLRHRRRCHPTPPPRDRSSHSPLPPLRAHPSVPISSSRTSEREASPLRGGRKHPRDSAGAAHDENPSSRPRLSDAEDDDDDRFGSRFSRNGMGNGGVFGAGNNYYEGNPVSSDGNYAPHLMFQNASGQFHNMNDPNHLEDASVLLSMAYPGGVPGTNRSNGEASSTSPSQAIAALAAEGDAPASSKNGDKETTNEPTFSSGAVDNPARPAAPGALLPESMGNFAGMTWLDSASQDVNDAFMSEGPRPLSPFNISNLFSPSTFNVGLGSPGEISNETTALAIAAAAAAVSLPPADGQTDANTTKEQQQQQQADANQVVAAILEQLAKNDVPETRGNPNPERPLLRLASKDVVVRAGQECPRSSRFYLPADRFAGCYQVPHWALPPLRTLSVMAARTYYSVLNHFPFVHDPTFRLVDTTACLAFAMCTVGGIRIGNNKKAGLLSTGGNSAASSPISTGGLWERVGTEYTQGVDPEEAEDQRRWQEWDAGNVVRHEKTNMLVKSFSLAKGVLMTEYNVALLQALILYHAPYFLSQNDQERRQANMFLGTIVNITRQIGFLLPNLEHADSTIHVPPIPHSPADLDRAWKRWVQLEGRRRTAFLVYHLDTVSAIESSISPILTPSELAAMPLPAPDSVWKAESAQAWYHATRSYIPMTLDEAMRRCFGLPPTGSFDELPVTIDFNHNILGEREYGPFARTAIILTLIRGVQDLGEGRRSRGDWRDLTDLWVSANHLRPNSSCYSADGVDLGPCSQEALRSRFALALQKWREGWDQDPSCSTFAMVASPSSSLLTPNFPSPGSTSTSDGTPKPKGTLMYCEEAMPFFFLAASLLNKLTNCPSSGRDAFSGTSYAELLEAARTLARASDGHQQRVGVF